MIRVVIVNDHPIFRQGIVSMLQSVDDIEVVGEAGSGTAAIILAQNIHPDIIIMDISLPELNGIEAAKRIKEQGIDTGIILLTMHKEAELLNMAQEFGIKGYLVKEDAIGDLIYAIRAVHRGDKFLSSSLNTGGTINLPKAPSASCPLTEREREIVTCVANGLSSKEIATKLCISVKTVETHRANIMEKIDIKNLAELVRYAVKTGLVQP